MRRKTSSNRLESAVMAQVYPLVTDLPDDYTRGIGLVMTHWAYVEHLLRKIAYQLVGVDVKRGRVAIRDPRPDDYIPMYRQLLRLNKDITIDDQVFDDLPHALAVTRAERDLIAHGPWIKTAQGEYLVPKTSGNWPKSSGLKLTKRELPEGIVIVPQDLEGLRQNIAKIATALEAIDFEIGAQLALKNKPREQSPQDRPQDDPTEKTPESPPTPSRE
jgi:hypothetical protein